MGPCGLALLLLAAGTAGAQQALDPRAPVAVAAWIRADGLDCPAVADIRLEGQTNRGNLYTIECYLHDSDRVWRYQMILSPDESHVSLYPCSSRDCPFAMR